MQCFQHLWRKQCKYITQLSRYDAANSRVLILSSLVLKNYTIVHKHYTDFVTTFGTIAVTKTSEVGEKNNETVASRLCFLDRQEGFILLRQYK